MKSLLFFLLAPSLLALASNVYLSNSGSDSNGDGTSSNPYQSLHHSVDASVSGDKIIVLPGTYSGWLNYNVPMNLHSLSIVSSDGFGSVKFVVDDSATWLYTSVAVNLTVDSLIVEGGNSGILVGSSSGSHLTVTNTEFRNTVYNSIACFGAAKNPNFYLENVTFVGCGPEGKGVSSSPGGTAQVLIAKNVSSESCSWQLLNAGNVTIQESSFDDSPLSVSLGVNQAFTATGSTFNGGTRKNSGFVFNNQGTISLINCKVQNFLDSGIVVDTKATTTFTLRQTLIAGNQGIDGGGLYLNGPAVTANLQQCQFDNNQATEGGAVYCSGSGVSVSAFGCEFDGNSATTTGGIAQCANNCQYYQFSNTFKGNQEEEPSTCEQNP